MIILEDISDPGRRRMWKVGAILAGALLLVWVLSFVALPAGSLRWLTLPLVVIFFVLALFQPDVCLYILLFALPLFTIFPMNMGTPNFSLAEIALLSTLGGMGIRKIRQLQVFAIRSPVSGLLGLFALVVVGSVILELYRNYLLTNSVFPFILGGLLRRVFVPHQEESAHFLRAALTLLEGLIVFHLALGIRAHPYKTRIAWFVLVAGSLFVAAYAYLQYVFGFRLIDFWTQQTVWPRRVNATWPDVNTCGTYFAVLFFVTLAMRQVETVRSFRVAWSVLLGLQLLALAMTFSKASMLALVVMLPLYALLAPQRAASWWRCWYRRRFAVALFVLLLIIPATLALMSLSPGQKLWRGLSDPDSGLYQVNKALKGRVNIWRGGLLLWADNPALGNGVGTFYRSLVRYYDPTLHYWNPPHENAHNYFLQLGAELGWLGLMSWLMAVGLLLVGMLAGCGDPQREFAVFHRGTLCAVGAILVTCLVGHPMTVPEMNYLFWGLLGLGQPPHSLPFEREAEAEEAETRRRRLALFARWVWNAAVVALVGLVGFQMLQESRVRVVPPMMRGVYGLEWDEEGHPFRWISGTFDTISYAQWREVNLQLRNPHAPGLPIHAKIFLDGKLVGEHTFADPQWKDFRYDAPELQFKYFNLRIELDRTVNPQRDYGIRDDRDLGLRLGFSSFLKME